MIFANQRALQDSAYARAELLYGREALHYINPDDRSAVRRVVRKRTPDLGAQSEVN